ncbi:TLC domain-containing protein 2 [Aplysia californica]|uniref:TLC domain-containing protein 2 n=1 Tax=Aplysia californica TaxID=6500 RepID=A0ABM0JV27_APLCA|nr:TLC domain-containing protein 2 [Aplysia californica]
MTEAKEPDFSAMRDDIELRHGVYFLFASMLFFQLVNWILKSKGPPKTLKEDEWKWRNLYVSWVHALIISIWCSVSLLAYPELFQNLLQHINYFTYFCVCLATGYFFYDFLDLIVNNKLFKMWEVSLHHIAVGGMFFYNVMLRGMIGFNVVAIAVEINSLFLHWRKLLQMVQTPYQSRHYLLIKYLNLLSFIVFRFGVLALITSSIFVWSHKVTTHYLVLISLSMLFMDVLNAILFWRLFKSDVLRGPSGGQVHPLVTLQRDWSIILWGVPPSSQSHHRNGYTKVEAAAPSANNNVPEHVKGRKED